MNITEWLVWVGKNCQRVREYKLGMDGTNGQCDCIGLVIGALRLAGLSWNGTHGSNYAARNRMGSLHDTAEGVSPGELVFKVHEPGDKGWSLPSAYGNHPDQRDYYHVGIVTGVQPLIITHCTGVQGGIKQDSALGQWKYAGYLTCITTEETHMKATVYAGNGKPVNLRRQPSAQSDRIAQISVGTTVTVTESAEEWSKVEYEGLSGYMMTKFLETKEEADTSLADRINLLTEKVEHLEDSVSALLARIPETEG